MEKLQTSLSTMPEQVSRPGLVVHLPVYVDRIVHVIVYVAIYRGRMSAAFRKIITTNGE